MISTKILVIDSHPVYSQKLTEFLTNIPSTDIYLSITGNEALALLQSKNIDLIILSSVLSDKDGLDLCQDIQEKTKFKGKIIIQTGLRDSKERMTVFKKQKNVHAIVTRREKNYLPLQKILNDFMSHTGTVPA
jgi:DNA-binding response OmpR family regulator